MRWVGRRGLVAAGAAVALSAAGVLTAVTATGHPAPSAPRPAAVAGAGVPARLAPWEAVLDAAHDLGPSHDPGARLVLVLRSPAAAPPVLRWAHLHGLAGDWSAGHDWLLLIGPAGRLGAAFGVRVDEYRTDQGATFYATRTDAGVPSGLRGLVSLVGRISSYRGYRRQNVPHGGLSPTGLLQAYDATPLVQAGERGAGATVVFIEIDGYNPANLNAFTAKYGLPTIQLTVVGGEAGAPEGESDMDIEAVHSIAPQAHLVYVNLNSFPGNGWLAAFQYLQQNYSGAVWSSSVTTCESNFALADLTALDSLVSTAERAGTTFFSSSGDNGGLDCAPADANGEPPNPSFKGVLMPPVLPSVTGVGGTTLSINTSGGYYGEEAWTESVLSQGSGGGVSTIVPRPSWQTGPGVGGSGVNAGFREVPDVAALADPTTGTFNYMGPGQPPTTQAEGGGTSLATPVWAGFTVLMDGWLAGHGGHKVGFLNPLLYHLADSSQPYPPLHDVTLGGNDFYPATPGYDMVTGLGSPDVFNLTRDLLAAQTGH